MRPRFRVLSVALVASLALITVGCSSDGGGGGNAAVTDENRPYVDAMKKSLAASNEEDGDIVLSDGQIDCIAPRFINIIGVDRLEENGVTAADVEADEAMDFSDLGMDEKEGNELYDTFGNCDVNLGETMMASFAEDDEMTDAMKTCMEGVFTDDNLRKLMVSTMVNGDDAAEDDPELAPLMAQLMGCAFMGMGDDMGEMDTEGGMNFEDDMDFEDFEDFEAFED